MNTNDHALTVNDTANPESTFSPDFLKIFHSDGFVEVGIFGVDSAGLMFCRIDQSLKASTNFAVYAFAGFTDGGKVLRIGKSEDRPVSKRILEYPRYINDACNKNLPSDGFYKGGTKPWERDEWFSYLNQFATGVIFVNERTFSGKKDQLKTFEKDLIDKYSPPFCNDSHAGRSLRKNWEAIHGKAQVYLKRAN